MISDLVTALGLVAVIEGLVLALAPLRFEELLAFLRSLTPETRRLMGFAAISFGVFLIALAGQIG
ncbi:DUF2065 domain-containing protein [Rhodovulum sp. YNF3179]|uniref:DUF2065 domain-containing protein n=1 Tax=Rhodovulum sp. YNF3179 TaxID=3425127 RepID=UPI003D3410EE